MWGESVNGVRLAAVAERDTFPAGRPVIIHVRLQYAGGLAPVLTLRATHPLADYDIGVTGPDGRPVALTPAGKDAVEFIQTGERFRNVAITLGPSETHEEVLTVSEWFDLSRPGRYALTLARRDWQDAQGRHPTAGPVTFSIA